MSPKKRNQRGDAAGSGHRNEIIAVVLFVAALFLGLALVSYRASDGDLFFHLTGEEPRNLGGRVGATLAALGFQLVGLGSYFGVAALCYLGWARLGGRDVDAFFTKVLGLALLLVAGCTLLDFGFGPVEVGGEEIAAGGLLGTWSALGLRSAFGPVGGPLFAATAAFVALLVITRLSLARIFSGMRDLAVDGLRRLRTTWTHWRESRRKVRQRRAVVSRYSANVEGPARGGDRRAEARASSPSNGGGALVTLKVPVVTQRSGAPSPASYADEQAPPLTDDVDPEPEPLPFEQPAGPDGSFALPDLDLLDEPEEERAIDEEEMMEKARAIVSKGEEFNVGGEVVAIHPGPVVTTFEFKPGTGVKYSRITNLQDDLSLALRAESVRIARLPGKATVGIEVPNRHRRVIPLREILESKAFTSSNSKLTLALGKQIHGETVVTDLARMPHLLIAGTTGSGKSVALNCMLMSLLYNATPDEVKLVMVDPKRLEFGLYEDIPHLLTPVVVEPKKAANALTWAVREMDRRYKLLAEFGVRSIDQFNLMLRRGTEDLRESDRDPEDLKPLPYIVVTIDELADLMIFASNVVEQAITRLSQMARAVGIHLILATQRPSVDVITGTIKNNLPARISFRVASKVDSRVILDTHGAETLLGKGDMLFLAPGTSRLSRVHGAFIDETEVKRVVGFWRDQARPRYEAEVTKAPPEEESGGTIEGEIGEEVDDLYEDAVRLIVSAGEASVSNIQRKLRVGYARAGRIVDLMEQEGIVGPSEGTKPRKVLVGHDWVEERFTGSPGP